MAKSKKQHKVALGAEYAIAMRTQYAEKVKPSKKAYTKKDRKNNKVKDW